MPKKLFVNVRLPLGQPDCCEECPLVALIPKEQRRRGSKETLVCLGTHEAMTLIGSKIRRSERRGTSHPWKRPCDEKWEMWQSNLRGVFPVRKVDYAMYRQPFEQRSQMIIKFHTRQGRVEGEGTVF